MADFSLASNLTNPIAFSGLALIVPIIILYLLKPKPKVVLFPSTMFIRFMEKNKRFTSFLQKFVRDPILFMQILIITLLVLTLVNPFYNTEVEKNEAESVVIVLDASASMKSTDVSPNRFDAAVAKAVDILSELNEEDDVSIVLAENIPIVVSTGKDLGEARITLERMKAADTPSNIGDAIMLGRDMLSATDKKKAIYAFSDFAGGGGIDVQLAKKIASISGVRVELVQVGVRGANAGLVSLNARRSVVRDNQLFLTASVRNYHEVDYSTTVRVMTGDRILDSKEKTIEAGGEEFYYFSPNLTGAEQIIRLEVIGGDDLSVDDIGYAHIPAVKVNRVLLLTSKGSDKFLRLMLDSLKNVKVEYAVPPVIPDVRNYDVIILGDAEHDKILPGDFRDIKNHVGNGANLVVVGSENLDRIGDPDLWSIMPVRSYGLIEKEDDIRVVHEHEMLEDVVFDNVVVTRYYNVEAADNSTKTLLSAGSGANPLMSYKSYGDGYVAFVGVNSNPEWSNLYYSSSFPIFWSQMLKYITRPRGSDIDKSLHTGEYLRLEGKQRVETPGGGFLESASVFLDESGVYRVRYEDKTDQFTVNLLNSLESNTTGADIEDIIRSRDFKVESEKVDLRVELFRHMLAVMLIALFIELFFYRRRGLL
ncbi:MAG: VWA domain-containing protein [Candidatus Altiarchaeales archaeon]|nr:VWA domain-containing protein [Candidatus Altiarchaeales archaeon]MBD3415884.1 VWA domain-containing protein [Candidatus Altiarchaeales archaeon]